MRDKYYDPEGWKQCTLRHNIELGQRLWLLCGTCQKSRYFDTAAWARLHGVDLDMPLRTLGRLIRCERCGTLGIAAYAQPYDNLPPLPHRIAEDGPVCPACGSSDVESRRMLTSEYPNIIYPNVGRPRFAVGKTMQVCGCSQCDNWWTQANGDKLPRNDASGNGS